MLERAASPTDANPSVLYMRTWHDGRPFWEAGWGWNGYLRMGCYSQLIGYERCSVRQHSALVIRNSDETLRNIRVNCVWWFVLRRVWIVGGLSMCCFLDRPRLMDMWWVLHLIRADGVRRRTCRFLVGQDVYAAVVSKTGQLRESAV